MTKVKKCCDTCKWYSEIEVGHSGRCIFPIENIKIPIIFNLNDNWRGVIGRISKDCKAWESVIIKTEAGPIINEMHQRIDTEKKFSEYLKRCYFNQVNLLEDFVEFVGEEKYKEFLKTRREKDE